jgi:hypothetical protein
LRILELYFSLKPITQSIIKGGKRYKIYLDVKIFTLNIAKITAKIKLVNIIALNVLINLSLLFKDLIKPIIKYIQGIITNKVNQKFM